jgi:hypothetical protein
MDWVDPLWYLTRLGRPTLHSLRRKCPISGRHGPLTTSYLRGSCWRLRSLWCANVCRLCVLCCGLFCFASFLCIIFVFFRTLFYFCEPEEPKEEEWSATGCTTGVRFLTGARVFPLYIQADWAVGSKFFHPKIICTAGWPPGFSFSGRMRNRWSGFCAGCSRVSLRTELYVM